ncbi:glucose 1-dehydrogenase [Pseudochryseolinea flava]|uniref:NAD(P)-dependent oxidoreductase n=1 Tax=Pseudochryseolinea flava TaxID=2059302 RepID=A0A364Y2B2_9BACT|nr:glucose 1-dehydrogenase [Pseudochryseolinea flava]RAW00829.1 NAD(P)-dependent oxidoreductase [Pseudochryseolinea flava]
MRKVILITGASRGIGAATAILAAKKGYDVAVNYIHDHQAAEKVVHEITREGGNAKAFQADIADATQVTTLFQNVLKHFGRLDVLVNNASIVALADRVVNFSPERIKRMFEVNVYGSFYASQEAIKLMSKKTGGHGGAIINVSSGASQGGSPNVYVDYAASKGAIDTFTIGLAKELATEGIRVNAVRPGLIDTEIHVDSGDANRAAKLVESIPLKRLGQPEEIAATILWLASDEASYVTGSILNVTGGR